MVVRFKRYGVLYAAVGGDCDFKLIEKGGNVARVSTPHAQSQTYVRAGFGSMRRVSVKFHTWHGNFRQNLVPFFRYFTQSFCGKQNLIEALFLHQNVIRQLFVLKATDIFKRWLVDGSTSMECKQFHRIEKNHNPDFNQS